MVRHPMRLKSLGKKPEQDLNRAPQLTFRGVNPRWQPRSQVIAEPRQKKPKEPPDRVPSLTIRGGQKKGGADGPNQLRLTMPERPFFVLTDDLRAELQLIIRDTIIHMKAT